MVEGSGASLAERLGFAADARVAVVHCDDIGMCRAANVGSFEALERGPASCGSVMVPCPWFRDAAEHIRHDPELDIGVHLTLNAEWPHYRWGPVLGASAVPSLVDAQGYLPRTLPEVLQNAKPEEVERELRAQIERALEAGIDVTHLDSHMGTVLMPPLSEVYAKLAIEFRLPVFIFRPDERVLEENGLSGARGFFASLVDRLEVEGVPILDGFDQNSLDFAPGLGMAHNVARLRGLGRGVSYLICHPARAGEELSAITDSAHARDFERSFYGGESGRAALAREGIEIVGMRAIRDLMRNAESR
jgi:predicted glycoside hydrolase/deacetylase ChbG (UPF0249 family)